MGLRHPHYYLFKPLFAHGLRALSLGHRGTEGSPSHGESLPPAGISRCVRIGSLCTCVEDSLLLWLRLRRCDVISMLYISANTLDYARPPAFHSGLPSSTVSPSFTVSYPLG